MTLAARGRVLAWPRSSMVMGVVNLGADSFSGDGVTNPAAALVKAHELIAAGAEIIDVGAESARTNRPAMSEGEEMDRLCAFIERWNADQETLLNEDTPLLSINTWRPAVARAALSVGGHILNDIGGLATDENARVCAETGAALVIMHTVGEPKVPHTHVRYDDVWARMEEFFAEKIGLAETTGLSREALILDPGIDFAKQCEDNLRILRELNRLRNFERPILLAASRKTVIGDVLELDDPAERDAGTVACIVQGMLCGAAIFRAHNVRAAVQAVRMIEAVEERAG